jgi:hypothetical protein
MTSQHVSHNQNQELNHGAKSVDLSLTNRGPSKTGSFDVA